ATEHVYAAMVVLLGYTNTFTRTNQWQGHAEYEVGTGEVCGFRRVNDSEDGALQLELYYARDAPLYVRSLFQGLFEAFLGRAGARIRKSPVVSCGNGHRQARAVVVRRIDDEKPFLFCEECGDRVALLGPATLGASAAVQPLLAAEQVQASD